MKMNFYYSIALILVFSTVNNADNVTPTNQLEQQILLLLNKWREGGVQTPLFPLPSLKTISYTNQIESYYDGKGIKIAFSIGDMQMTGLDSFSVDYLNVTQTLYDINVSAKLVVPVLTLHSDSYVVKGRAYLFYPLQGFGRMTVLFRNVEVFVGVNFANVTGVNTKITGFLLEFNVGQVEANLESSSWPINQMLNKEGVDIIENYHDEIVKAVWSYAVPYANDYLAKITPENFLKIIADISVNSYVTKENTK